ncbi:MAG: hypothetical protein K0S54_424 [Alphaproteobacteria bacterium]|jgi:hypothetical protein|nr:hypothetical protein [Alphaproteobacteria bacterium]
MSANKPPRPPVRIAPEFSGLGGLAQALKGDGAGTGVGRNAAVLDGDATWTVLGVSALWQTAAENAARLSGMELNRWLALAIADAAVAQGVKPAAASHDAPDDRA